MTKAIITKEQAAAIEYLRTKPFYSKDDTLLVEHAKTLSGGEYNEWGPNVKALRGMSMDTFARAILNGYEIQKTPEEEVKTFFWYYDDLDDTYEQGIRKGALRMLEIYGIKVKGVNA